MSATEQRRVLNVMENVNQGNEAGDQLEWDSVNKTIRTINHSDPYGEKISVGRSDMDHFTGVNELAVITIQAEQLARCNQAGGTYHCKFRKLDDGDAYSTITADRVPVTLSGSINIIDPTEIINVSEISAPEDLLRIIAYQQESNGAPDKWHVEGYIHNNGHWEKVPVNVVPMRDELFSRTRGLFETDVLAAKQVSVFGGGSGGSPIVQELARLGVGNLIIMDHDRLEVANVVRHPAGLSDVGRYKTKFLAEIIHETNPYATVTTYEEKVSPGNEERTREIIRKSDIIICAVDDNKARHILNRICVEEGKPVIIAGCFRRAYGGQVLAIRPGETMCYQCFVQAAPEKARDQEISSRDQAEQFAYSDRPVAIEPGLANDIAPISTMVTKLAIQQLLQGHPTTLSSLEDDLIAPWYIWLNRREVGTDYEQLGRLGFNVDGMRILRWYGINMERNPDCPICGNFLGSITQQEGFEITEEDEAVFACCEENR